MSSDDKDGFYQIRQIGETSGNNIVPIGPRALQDDEESREYIRRMAEIGHLSYSEMADLRIIHPGMRIPKTLNAFRQLRTKIYQLANAKDNFVLLVTAITPNGGSSFVTTNLGAAIALDESKTAIIVDCNVYDPSLHRLLPIDPDYGLVDYLENITLDVKDVIYSTGVRRLRMIPAGSRRQPGTEFFTSSRMRKFVDELRTRYRDRHIVIDAPPVGSSADARILADLCDFVLIVVPFGAVAEGQVHAAIEAIGEKKVIGVVFNN
ncbi:MAG TPA: CpsD/CapB family tyrosine-protein kinase [Spongiibacteraceae bacterium]|jgi:exopolysaccharide/PEP-CTERM locus tyrosine autokinase